MTDNTQDVKNNNIDPADGDPNEAAQVLHGDRARAEHYDQPEGDETVTLDADTIVAKHPVAPSDQSAVE